MFSVNWNSTEFSHM